MGNDVYGQSSNLAPEYWIVTIHTIRLSGVLREIWCLVKVMWRFHYKYCTLQMFCYTLYRMRSWMNQLSSKRYFCYAMYRHGWF